MKRNILVTGASGYLGTRLLNRLRQKGEFTIFAASHKLGNSSFQHLDISDVNELKKVIRKFKPHIVFHLAANVDLSRDFDVAKKCIDINILGTLNLLEALRQNPPERLIVASTEEVYGNNPPPFKEFQLPKPPSAYSISKIVSEHLCHLYAQELGFYLTIFRIATFYGPESTLNRFIPQIIYKALNNENIPLNSGQKKRDYIYVDDVIDALIIAMGTKKAKIELLNLGGGKSYRLKDVVDLIIKITGSRSRIILNAIPERLNEAEEWLMNIDKAYREIGWQPKTSLDNGIKRTVEYFKMHYI